MTNEEIKELVAEGRRHHVVYTENMGAPWYTTQRCKQCDGIADPEMFEHKLLDALAALVDEVERLGRENAKLKTKLVDSARGSMQGTDEEILSYLMLEGREFDV